MCPSEAVCINHVRTCPRCGRLAAGELRLEGDMWVWTCIKCGYRIVEN
jgi:ribosomal protein L37AE/L43A